MAQDITCPNCGGILFSDDAETMELSPCTCTKTMNSPAASTRSAESSRAVETSSIRASMSSAIARPTSAPSSSEPKAHKVCCNCGKDVSGRKRLKDSEGRYWCPQCGKKDEKAKKVRKEQTRTTCTRCGCAIKVQDVQTYDGQFVCLKCYREQKDLEKKTEARIGRINNAFEGQDMKRLVPMLIILGILGIIIVWKTIMGLKH